MLADALSPPEGAQFLRRKLDLPGEIRLPHGSYPCQVSTLSASGAEVVVGDTMLAEAAFGETIVLVVPSIGQYKARRMRRAGLRAAYLFELTEFSARALDALIADRFPD